MENLVKPSVSMVEPATEEQKNPAATIALPPRQKTAGEVLFDRTVYTGIGFGVNEVSSLWITEQFMNGKNIVGKWFSKEGFDAASHWLAKTFKMKDGVDAAGKVIPKAAKGGNLLLMVTLLSGGTLLIWPMKKFEDHKLYLVKKCNHFMDWVRGSNLSKEQVAARDDEVEQHIACAPEQTWTTMLLGRVVACSASVLTGTFLVGTKNNEKLMDWSERLFTGSVKPADKRGATSRYARLLSVETYSCAISSIVMEMMSKLFAKRGVTLHDPEVCRSAAAHAEYESNGSDAENKSSKETRPSTYSAKIQAQKMHAAAMPMAMHA